MTSVAMIDVGIMVPVGNIPMTGIVTPAATELADPRNSFETVNGMAVYYGGDLNDYAAWEDWTFGTGIAGFSRTIRNPSCLL